MSETLTIGEKTFTLKKLSVADQQKVYFRIVRAMSVVADDDGDDVAVMVAAMSGLLSEEDMKVCTEVFGRNCRLETSDGRVFEAMIMKDGKDRNGLEAAFSDDFADLLQWLEWCVRTVYAPAVAKLKGALSRKHVGAPKAEPKEKV